MKDYYNKMEKKCGIYIIHCGKNNKVYIGSSKNIIHRVWDHWSHMKQGKGINPHIQAAWDLYGKECFSHAILEECIVEQFEERESYWIRFYDSINPEKGFNINIPDEKEKWLQPIKERNKTKEPIIKKERIKKNYPIICINTNNGHIGRYDNVPQAIKDLDIKEKQIYKCFNYWKWVKGEAIKEYNRMRSIKGYLFMRQEQYNPLFDYIGYKPKRRKRKL